MTPFLADCHLHLEGSLPRETLATLARRASHPFADPMEFERARSAARDPESFLALYAEVCRLFRGPDDYAEAARSLAAQLTREGIAYAEVFVSPEICRRLELPAGECLRAVSDAFSDTGATRCRILLDVVRQWGPESAHRVLDLYEREKPAGVVGLGMGGDEASLPAKEFAGVYARARALGLQTTVHAGEWSRSESVREALDALRPDRIDHGIAAADDPNLVRRLAEEDVTLWVALSSNVATGAVGGLPVHPLTTLLDAGVRVALAADDPLLFATTTRDEYRIAREELSVPQADLRRMAENAWHSAFCPVEERRAGAAALAGSDL